jgi:aspartyl-tRNA(Asn)/glutamyl-tRNA(Gln) amidotransferase subunit A
LPVQLTKELLDLDACGISELYRKGALSPSEFVEACLDAIAASKLNAFCYVNEAAAEEAARADTALPFGGVPFGVKELDPVSGWPYTRASLVFKDERADRTATYLARLKDAGAVFLGQTTASEFGGINLTYTKIHGATLNPWALDRTPGGSSGGSAAAVAGGLCPIATGGDGGGSIRIPAGFTGLFGFKCTYGLIPKGPPPEIGAVTAVMGCLSKSVRDTAAFLDVVAGEAPTDPLSLPKLGPFASSLEALSLEGLPATISPDLLGSAVVDDAVAAMVEEHARAIAREAGLKLVAPPKVKLPSIGTEWAATNLVDLLAELGDKYPACEKDLTPEIMFGLNIAWHHYDARVAAAAVRQRTALNEAMAELFSSCFFVFASTNPDVAFNATGPLPTVVGGRDLVKERGFVEAAANNGALTIPSNIYGNPAASIPAGTKEGLPVGTQVLAPRLRDAELLALSAIAERAMPWPRTAPGAPL